MIKFSQLTLNDICGETALSEIHISRAHALVFFNLNLNLVSALVVFTFIEFPMIPWTLIK